MCGQSQKSGTNMQPHLLKNILAKVRQNVLCQFYNTTMEERRLSVYLNWERILKDDVRYFHSFNTSPILQHDVSFFTWELIFLIT